MDFEEEVVQQPSPRQGANFVSVAFFWWLNPLLKKGYRRELQIGDLYRVLDCDASEGLGNDLEKAWFREKQRVKEIQLPKNASTPARQPSLLRAMISTFGLRFSVIGIFTFYEECVLRLLQPLLMCWFIRYFSPATSDSVTETEAMLYGGCFVLLSIVYTFVHHAYFFSVMHLGMKVRVALCSMVFRKALRLSKSALGKNTVGQMVNLLSNDVNRFDNTFLFLHYLWAGPIQMAVVVWLTWQQIGISTLAGAILVIFFVPLQSWIGQVFSRLRLKTAEKTDERIRIMNEIVNGVKVIKMYAWELAFSDLVAKARREEIDVIRKASYYRSFNFSFFFTSTKLLFLAILVPFVLTGNILTAESAFFTLALYNTVRLSMTLFFPFAISQISEAFVSIKRIQNFLMQEEMAEVANSVLYCNTNPSDEPKGISMVDVCAKWDPDDTGGGDTLKNVNFRVSSSQICGIIGSVGSGKSSVLNAVLGEIHSHSGKVKVNGVVSYASQEPWIFSGSVRHNILFGLDFDLERYSRVVSACALEDDFRNWDHKDHTLVGEKGVALSGGQKARVSLARAVYRDADIYLLDDPLSAVDAHVGRHLYERCVRGLLKEKAVVLVTHQLQYLRDVDNILVMKAGAVEAEGTFTEIMAASSDLSEFLTNEEEEKEGVEGNLKHAGEIGLSASKFRINLLKSRSKAMEHRCRSTSMGGESLFSLTSEDLVGSQLVHEEKDDEDEEDEEKEVGEDYPMKKKPALEEEAKNHGSVSLGTYLKYFSAGGSCLTVPLMLALNIITHLVFTATDLWIAYWTNTEEKKLKELQQHNISFVINTNKTREEEEEDLLQSNQFNMSVFAGLTLTLAIFALCRTNNLYLTCMRSSNTLHNNMFSRIIRAPSRFFDTNPVGRILNRFSKDIGSVDEILPPTLMDVVGIYFTIAGTICVIVSFRPIVLPPTAFIFVLFYFLRNYYLASSRSIKRLEGVTKSPIFTQLSSSLHGLTTIRAYNAEAMLAKEFDHLQDIHSSTWYAYLSTARWFGLWLDWIVTLYLGVCVSSFMFMADGSLGGDVGLVLSSCTVLTGMLQYGMRQSAEMENLMTSVERILEYSNIESEADLVKMDKEEKKKEWPSEGKIVFKNVCLKYGEEMVLKGLNFATESKEKIGIVGRTGAGKSSMITALFRLTEPTGDVFIDGRNLRDLGLHDVRKKLSIIPQDPILFTGSLRRNLDPFDEYEDDEVWDALTQVNLDVTVREGMPQGLNSEMSEGGANLSVGQRQLVCLARAVLRGNKILVLDEATANVDPKTDGLIQETIRVKFKDCTVLTIAHRLHTVMDSDRLMVLADGKVEEFDTPHNLLQNPHGLLMELVRATDRSTQNDLIMMAKKSASKKQQQSSSSDD